MISLKRWFIILCAIGAALGTGQGSNEKTIEWRFHLRNVKFYTFTILSEAIEHKHRDLRA